MILLIIGCVVLFLFSGRVDTNQITIHGYKTKYFTPHSKVAYDQIKTLEFAIMEDRFMECELLTVHRGVSHLRHAIEIHQKMTEMYPKVNLNYHNMALNHMGRPAKTMDPNLIYL